MDSSRATACDLCRLRKVRCDKSVPCFNCRQATQECTFTGAGQKPKVPRQRVLISAQYEEKLDIMDQRLAKIESLLLNQQAAQQCSCSQPKYGHHLPVATAMHKDEVPDIAVFDDHEEDSPIEGSSSLRSQMQVAQQLTESAVDLGASSLANTMTASQKAIGFQTSPRAIDKRVVQPISPYRSMPLPPTSAVVDILKKLKESPPSSFFVMRCFQSSQAFIDLCREVYFSIDDYSDTDFIIVNSGLYYLFTEYFIPKDNVDLQKQFISWGALCRTAVTAAISSLGANLPARAENVQALILGTTHAIEMAKPWFAWRLICFAAQLCVAAGFHDDTLIYNKDKETKSFEALLFWHVYSLEKTLALRVGRASLIRDCDINLSRDLGSFSLPRLWDTIVPFWIANASIHGRLYDSLYSRAAQSMSPVELVIRADELLVELKAIEPSQRVRHMEVPGTASITRLEDVLAISRNVSYYTTATLISRAKSLHTMTPKFLPDCLENARAAINAHHECLQMMNEDRHVLNIYLHWRILQTPFIPVIILFCNVMETLDGDDERRLKDFADSLEGSANLSPSAGEFYRISRDLHNIAQRHLDTRMEQNRVSMSSLSTFGLNQYFAANDFENTENYRLASDLSSQDMELMFGGQQIMGFF